MHEDILTTVCSMRLTNLENNRFNFVKLNLIDYVYSAANTLELTNNMSIKSVDNVTKVDPVTAVIIKSLTDAGFTAEKRIEAGQFSFLVSTNAGTPTGFAGYVFTATKVDDTESFNLISATPLPGSLSLDLTGKTCLLNVQNCVSAANKIKESVAYWHSHPAETGDLAIGLLNDIVEEFIDDESLYVVTEEVKSQYQDKPEVTVTDADSDEETDDEKTDDNVPELECDVPMHAYVVNYHCGHSDPQQGEVHEFGRLLLEALDKVAPRQFISESEFSEKLSKFMSNTSTPLVQSEAPKPTFNEVINEVELVSKTLNSLSAILVNCPYLSDPMMLLCIKAILSCADVVEDQFNKLKILTKDQ